MTSLTSITDDPHRQIRLLLPWYLNQSLPFEEHRRVEFHIRDCPACRRELANLENIATTLTEIPEPVGDAEASFAALRVTLPQREANRTLSVAPVNAARYRKKPFLGSRNAVRFAMAAMLLLAVIPSITYHLRTTKTEQYYTLSDAKPASSSQNKLRVVFAKSLSKAEISAVLAEVHGRQIGEPNSMGAFTVRLEDAQDNPAQMETAIALLRSRQDVMLAEPAVQP